MWVCPPKLTKPIIDHYNITYDLPNVSEGAMASAVGKIRSDGFFIIHSKNEAIANAPANQVTKGFLYDRETEKSKKEFHEPNKIEKHDLNETILL